MLRSILVVCVLVASATALPSFVKSGPLHASCHMTVTYNSTQCGDVLTALKGAVSKLSGSDCGSGEKCLYTLVSSSATELKTTHATPVKHYKDDQTFSFSAVDGGCSVKAFSTSETWYAVLDDGTNYCNLHNLAAETGLTFSETVDDSTCTQYSKANCDKY